MKLCKKCNKSFANSNKFCPECGSTLEEEVIDAAAPVTAENVTGMSSVDTKAQIKGGVEKVKGKANELVEKVKKDEKTRNIAVGVVAGIVLLVVLKLFIFPSPMSVLKTYCKGMKSYNASKVISTYNKDMVKELDDKISDFSKDYDTYKEYLKESFKDAKDDYKIKSYEIDKDYDEFDKDDLEDLADEIEDAFDIKASKVKAAREYKVKFKVKGDDGTETNKVKVTLVKIGLKWYVLPSLGI